MVLLFYATTAEQPKLPYVYDYMNAFCAAYLHDRVTPNMLADVCFPEIIVQKLPVLVYKASTFYLAKARDSLFTMF